MSLLRSTTARLIITAAILAYLLRSIDLGASLHAMLAERARGEGRRLNQFIVHLLSAGAVDEQLSGKLEALMGRVQGVERQLAAQAVPARPHARATNQRGRGAS